MIIDNLFSQFSNEQITLIEQAVDSGKITLYESYEDLYTRTRYVHQQQTHDWIENYLKNREIKYGRK